jgi:hypothetical protein
VRLWCNKFGPPFSKRLERRHPQGSATHSSSMRYSSRSPGADIFKRPAAAP